MAKSKLSRIAKPKLSTLRPTEVDILFVVNQDFDPEELKSLCSNSKSKPGKIMILSTHLLLPLEKQQLKAGLPVPEVIIDSFADWLSDRQMEAADDAASSLTLKSYGREETKSNYHTIFMDNSLFFKNQTVYRNLTDRYNFQRIYYCNGLGISKRFWQKVSGAKQLCPSQIHQPKKESIASAKFNSLKSLMSVRKNIIIEEKGDTFIFIDPPKRLRIKPEYRIEVKKSYFSNFRSIVKMKLGFHGKADRRKNSKNNRYICTTLHSYDFNRLKQYDKDQVIIFIDGYLPPNYPRTYIDAYPIGKFVPMTPFDYDWITKFNKSTFPIPDFIKPIFFKDQIALKKVKRVAVCLNHAGDWTALINRSDTDIIIETTIEVAKKFPDIDFVIRLHPTMAHPQHEGTNSMKRLQNYIPSLKISNLRLSSESLEADLEQADIIISEYSNVLLSAYEVGKLGIIINLTKRRSFMDNFIKLGFLHAGTTDGLSALIGDIAKDTKTFISKQSKAASAYNALMSKFINDMKT